jgi:uncharacterized damage-inducible protein DinB
VAAKGTARGRRDANRFADAGPARLDEDMSSTGYDGMWLPPEQDPRGSVSFPRGERENLVEYLERYRQTLVLKCEGLSPEQLGRRSVPPSTLSLLGLVRHLARVEHFWFRIVIEGRADLDRPYSAPEEATGFGFADPDDALVADAWQRWETEVAHAREVLSRVSLDEVVDVRGDPAEVRDLVIHMIEEYARHLGHADLLRECIDGRTGQ